MTHLYWFAYHNAHSASVRYRGLYVVEYLKREFNYSCDFIVPGYSFGIVFRFIRLFCEIVFFKKKNAVIVVQKVHSKGIYARAIRGMIRLSGLPVIYDIDDAEYLRCDPTMLHSFLQRADVCVVGSKRLQHYCMQFNQQVAINTSPVIAHNNEKYKENEVFTIGWIGGYNTNNPVSAAFSHKLSLHQLFFPALKEIDIPIHLILLGVTEEEDVWQLDELFKANENIRIEVPLIIDWQDEDYIYRQLARCDIGVAPMVDHPFNHAKSAFKVKQYLSCGVPVLASDVGENGRFVHHGENGYLCSGMEDFRLRLIEFMEMDIHTRQKFSTCAKASASEFDMEGYCDVIRGVIQSVTTEESSLALETNSSHITNRHSERTRISNQSA
ncbi:MAG: glycosyltransferase [Flavobacteriales bacterium]